MKTTYKCKQNDAVLQFHGKDGNIDELWVKIEGETSWTVVGYSDLTKGIEQAKKKCKLKD